MLWGYLLQNILPKCLFPWGPSCLTFGATEAKRIEQRKSLKFKWKYRFKASKRRLFSIPSHWPVLLLQALCMSFSKTLHLLLVRDETLLLSFGKFSTVPLYNLRGQGEQELMSLMLRSRNNLRASHTVTLVVKNSPANAGDIEMQIPSWGQEDSLEEGMATQSSIIAWRIPWTEEPGGLQSKGLQSWTPLSN